MGCFLCVRSFLVALALCVMVISAESGSNSSLKKHILSFGGNGMVGSEVLMRLIGSKEEQYDITLVSRGRWPFDTREKIKPHVRFIQCDRDHLEDCPKLLRAVKKTKEYYAILDFSGFYPQWVKDAVELLQGKVRVYIYVSTDSVYEVSKPTNHAKSLEIDAVRPDDDDLREELNDMDSYGDEKLEGEEVLVEQGHEDNGFPYVFLRFADIIGPRDGSARFVTYYLWTRYHHIDGVPPLSLPHDNLESSSITFVGDAATSILATMVTPESWNEAYNVACQENFNVTEAIGSIAEVVIGRILPIKKLWPQDDDDGDGDDGFSDPGAMYPSITRGPIDVSKVLERLPGFIPTPLDKAIRITCQWYDQEFKSNEESRIQFVDEWAENLFGEDEDLDEARRATKERVVEEILSAFSDEL